CFARKDMQHRGPGQGGGSPAGLMKRDGWRRLPERAKADPVLQDLFSHEPRERKPNGAFI
ncbi:MAG TPA: hypothetical protein DCQ40_16810, partial [Hyphomonas sp.]|nr:hypothetical protein [Hyphomonas sp.]